MVSDVNVSAFSGDKTHAKLTSIFVCSSLVAVLYHFIDQFVQPDDEIMAAWCEDPQWVRHLHAEQHQHEGFFGWHLRQDAVTVRDLDSQFALVETFQVGIAHPSQADGRGVQDFVREEQDCRATGEFERQSEKEDNLHGGSNEEQCFKIRGRLDDLWVVRIQFCVNVHGLQPQELVKIPYCKKAP